MAGVPYHSVDTLSRPPGAQGRVGRDLRADRRPRQVARARSSARWCASSRRARSPTTRCSSSAAKPCSPRSSRDGETASASPGWTSPPAASGARRPTATKRSRPSSSGCEPAELLVAGGSARGSRSRRRGASSARPGISMRERARALLTDQFGTLDLRGFGCDDLPLAIGAAGALLQYVRETQKTALPHITALARRSARRCAALDAATRRNLELDATSSGARIATLFALLDSHRHGHGRARAASLAQPAAHATSRNCGAATRRIGAADRRAPLRRPARTAARHRRRRAHPRARRAALGAAARPRRPARRARRAAGAARAARALDAPLLAELATRPGDARRTSHDLLQRAIAEEPPALLRDGGVIAAGYDAELDELRAIATHTDEFLLELEARERERTGIAQLKLGYNRVSGFYIEVTAQPGRARARTDYMRRQTVKNAERFITPELKSFEDKVLGARERALARERELYEAAARRSSSTELARAAGARPRRSRCARRAREPRRARRAAALDASRSSSTSRASRSTAGGTRWSSASSTSRSCPTTSARRRAPHAHRSPARTWAASPRTCARPR